MLYSELLHRSRLRVRLRAAPPTICVFPLSFQFARITMKYSEAGAAASPHSSPHNKLLNEIPGGKTFCKDERKKTITFRCGKPTDMKLPSEITENHTRTSNEPADTFSVAKV